MPAIAARLCGGFGGLRHRRAVALNAGDGVTASISPVPAGSWAGKASVASHQFYRSMIVAMAIMRVMQPSVYEVIDVITVGHAFVSAARPVRVFAPGVGGAP